MGITTCDNWDLLAQKLKYTDSTFVDFLKNTEYLEKSLDNYQTYLKATAKSTSAFGTVLNSLIETLANVAINMTIMFAVSKAASTLYELSQISDTVAQKASNLGAQFKSTKSDISSYNEQIAELYKTINDSSSSLEAVTTARKNLLSIQDELIDKFGTEKDVINIVTDAINGQSDALNRLTKKQWQETLNNFNNGNQINDLGNWMYGYSNNVERMLDEFGNYTAKINVSDSHGKWNTDEAKKIVKQLQEAGAELSYSIVGDENSVPILTLNGTASEVYKKLLNIQELFSDENPLSTQHLRNELTKLTNSAHETATQYEDIYNQYILYEKIFKNDTYADSFNKINNAYSKYQDALISGDKQAINEATKNFSNILNAATNGLTDESVINFFNEMYPTLKSIVSQWNFNADIIPTIDISKLKGKTQNDVLQMLQTDGLQEGEEEFNTIISKAKEYGLITDDDSKNIRKLLNLLSEWGILQKDITIDAPKIIAPITKSNAISEVNNLSDGFDSLNRIISSINDKDNPFDFALLDDQKFKESFQNLGDSYTDFIDTIANSPKDIASCQDALNNLVTAYLNQNGITNVLDENTKTLVVSMLENMGVTNAEAIATEYLAQKQAALAAERYFNTNAADDLANGTLAEYVAFLNEADAADVSKQALAQLELSKIAVNGVNINTSSDIDQIINLANAAGASATVLAKLSQAKAIYAKAESKGLNGSAGDLKMLEEADKIMADISSGNFNWDFHLDSNNFKSATYSNDAKKNKQKSSGAKSTPQEEQPKEFDWIKIRNENLKKEHDNFEKIFNDETKSYEEQLDAIDNLIAKDKERLKFSTDALSTYQKKWAEVSAKLKEEDITNIKNGNDFVGEYTGQYAKDLQEAADIYKEITSFEEEISSLDQEQNDHIRKQVELRGKIIDAQQDEIKGRMALLQSRIDLVEAQGGVVSERMIQSQIRLSEDLMRSYTDKIDNLYDQMEHVDPDSAAYSTLLAQINDCEGAIIDCKIQQQEWNEKIMRLPIERIQKYLNMLANIKQDLQNFLDEQSAMGINPTADQLQQLFDISKEEIKSLLEQQEKLKGLLEQYRFGSEKFNDVSQELQDIDNTISGLIQSQKEWNASILQIPVDQMGKLNDTLNLVSSTLDNVLSDYDSALTAVTGVIDKQTESLEDLKSAAEESYQSKIDPLQQELDLLQKQNEERQTQLDLEQRQYDLDRARNQKSNKVIRNGEMVYEADSDAIRDASQGLADAQYNKLVQDLGNQITALEEERDKLLESYNTQIEKLGEIKDKWSSIVDEIQLAADVSKADNLLGQGWQDKILSGNDDDIYNLFKGLYENTSSQKSQLEEQTASNERIAEMMNQFVTRYQEGSISYEQAMAGIQELSEQMKDGYSSLEQLNALLGLNGVDNLESLLQNMQTSANASVNQFSDYMEIVKANADAMNQYTSSWEEMQQNIKDQIAALKRLAEEAAKAAEAVKTYVSNDRNDSSGSSRGPNVNDNHYVSSGPGHTAEALADAIAGGKEILEYHSGGLVGAKETPSRYIGLLSSKNLSKDEVYGKLLKREWVLTEEQQRILDANVQSILKASSVPMLNTGSNLSYLAEKSSPSINITMGDTILENVSRPDEFARALATQFRPLLRQEMSKL